MRPLAVESLILTGLIFQGYSTRLNLSSVNNSAGLQMKILLCFVWLKVFLVPKKMYKYSEF